MSAKHTASIIKQYVKKFFPLVKVWSTSSVYSGGSSVDVNVSYGGGESRNAVGTECPNTGGVLLSVSEDGDRCNVRRVVIGGHSKVVNEPSWLTWNKMFF